DGSTPSPAASPCTRQVLPAPSGPESPSTSPARRISPNARTNARVSAGLRERTQRSGLIAFVRRARERAPGRGDAGRELGGEPADARAEIARGPVQPGSGPRRARAR